MTYSPPSNYAALVAAINADRNEAIAQSRILQMRIDRCDEMLEHLNTLFGDTPQGDGKETKRAEKERMAAAVETFIREAHPKGIHPSAVAQIMGISPQRVGKLAELSPSLQSDGLLWHWIPPEAD